MKRAFFSGLPMRGEDLTAWNTLFLCRAITGTMSECVSPIGDFCQVGELIIRARSLLLGFSISYSTRSQSSRVRWSCCWWDVISVMRRSKRGRAFRERRYRAFEGEMVMVGGAAQVKSAK